MTCTLPCLSSKPGAIASILPEGKDSTVPKDLPANLAVVAPRRSLEELGAIARVRAMARAAQVWADLCEYADAWDAARYVWNARAAASAARTELAKAQNLGLSLEIVETFVAEAQEHAQEAVLLAADALRAPLDGSIIERLRSVQLQAWSAWLSCCDNHQPEASLEAEHLRAVFEHARRQQRAAAWLHKRLHAKAPPVALVAIPA
jgi:hypothetical protein